MLARVRRLAPDLRPLRTSRDFRLLWIGQAVSLLGSMVTYVALPFQVYKLTGSSFDVGLLGGAELVPLLLVALVGGALADASDRRRVALAAEVALMVVSALLALNASLTHPHVWALYGLAAVASACTGLGRPSLGAMIPRLVAPDEVTAAAALQGMYGSIGLVGGPALGGVLLATIGLGGTYLFDVATFLVSLVALRAMSSMPPAEDASPAGLSSVFDGLRFLKGKPVLQGTYLLDFNAMIFGMPKALFPALAITRFGGGPRVVGLLYGAPALGSLAVTVTSGWAGHVRRHGLGVSVGVAMWGAAIVVFGLTRSLPMALAMLAVAGAGDMISGLFRMTIWNQVIPDDYRGRLEGIAWANVSGGPLLGDVEAGAVAAWRGPQFSVVSGGLACLAGVALFTILRPTFVRYRSTVAPAGDDA